MNPRFAVPIEFNRPLHAVCRQHLPRGNRFFCHSSKVNNPNSKNTVDEWCIPLERRKPTSIPNSKATALTDEALIRLHHQSALKPPDQGSPEFEKIKVSLQSMLAMVDSVKDFQPTDQVESSDSYQIPDGRIWPANESLPIDWESLVRDQEKFIESRKLRIPGKITLDRSAENQNRNMDSTCTNSVESKLVLSMAIEGVHTSRRRGIGQKPNSENVFYVAKQPRLAKRV